MALNDEDITAITALHLEWIRREQTGGAGTVVDLCTDDVVFLAPGQAPIVGRAGVTAWLGQADQNAFSVASEIRSLRGDRSVAYKLAAFRSTMRDTEAGHTHVVSGSHLWVLERDAQGVWRVAFATWSLHG